MGNSPDNKLDKEALERVTLIMEAYFDGGLNPQTEEKLQGWLADGENAPEKDAALQSIWMKTVEYDPAPGKYAYNSLEEIRGLLGFPAGEKPKKPIRKVLFRVAAVLIPVLFLTGIGYLALRENVAGIETDVQQPSVIEIIVEASDDRKRYVVLPDGSEVWINRSGRIAYADDFEENRVVHLDGEAYFSVTKRDGKPFEVVGTGVKVKVLGTKFNVVSYAGTETAVVTLSEGAVEVVADEKTVLLEPLEELVYDRMAESLVVQEVRREEIAPWRCDALTFDDTPLGEVFQAISNRYGVQFAIDERLPLDRPIRARFNGEDSLEDVMFVVQRAVGMFDYEIETKMVVVTKK